MRHGGCRAILAAVRSPCVLIVAKLALPLDTDGDRIADTDDKCPTEPETYNGVDDENGCPDHNKAVIGTSNPPAIAERVVFAKDSAKPLPQSRTSSTSSRPC